MNTKNISVVKRLSFAVAGAGVFAAASFFVAVAQAQVVPLAVTCNGVPSDSTNTITWTASPTGGEMPYTYLWSGDAIAGDTSSTVTGNYNSTGTFDAGIQVTDASSTVASSTCSATIAGSAATSTPTSTPPSADVSIMKTVDNANPATSTDVNYTLTVSALGPDTSTDVVANDLLPSGETFENATATVGSYDNTTGAWTIGDMTPSSTATLMIETMINSGTEGQIITNTATVNESSTETDPNTANNSSDAALTVQSAPTSTTPVADLSVTKTVDDMTPASDTMVNYTITVSALGPDTSTAAMATDLLPSGLTFENATASEGTYASSTGMWTIGDMMPNSTATLAIEALVNPDTQGDVITNTATVGEASSVMNMASDTSADATITVQPAATSTEGGGGGTPTSTNPLAVSCDWSVGSAPNIITWYATATGGTMPYNFLWSGNDITSGTTSSTVTVTYPAPGAYFSTVEVTDAASSTATAPCSISIGSTGSTPPPPTTKPQTLNIGPRGAFEGLRMIVTSVGSGNFQATIWGVTYTVNWSRVRPALTPGDTVNVIGRVTTAAPMTVSANSVTKM